MEITVLAEYANLMPGEKVSFSRNFMACPQAVNFAPATTAKEIPMVAKQIINKRINLIRLFLRHKITKEFENLKTG